MTGLRRRDRVCKTQAGPGERWSEMVHCTFVNANQIRLNDFKLQSL